jgi:cysteinyl-tRNA synthetase
MFTSIKENLAEYYVKKKFSRKQNSEKNFQKFFSESKKILILLPTAKTSLVEEVVEIIRLFAIHKKELFIIQSKDQFSFLPNEFKYSSLIINEEDKTAIGLPNKELVKRVKKHTFDLVLDLNRNPDLFSIALANIPLSDFRVGFVKKDSDYYYNFQIPNEINPEKSYRNLLNSLRMF